MTEGKCIILSAPSGAGKTTLIKRLIQAIPEISFSISATSRAARGTEQNGVEYFFLTVDEFRSQISKNSFVEWEEVYVGHYYGTLTSEISRIWAEGNAVAFDVDVVGGLSLKKYFGPKALAIFVEPPSMMVLEERLRARKTESESQLTLRLNKSKYEMSYAKQFDKTLLNDDLERASTELIDWVKNFIAK